MTFSGNCQVNTAVGGSALESTSDTSAASYNGTAFAFDTDYPVGSFANTGFPNHLFVVAPSGLTLTATSPASQDDGSGRLKYGVMLNPNLSSSASQGWDELLGEPSLGIAYDDALNVDPSKSGGSSQAISGGNSLVKAIRLIGLEATQYYMFEGYVVLHVLAATPPLNAYPPSATATTKRVFSRADVDLTIFRSLNLPASFQTYTEIQSRLPQDCAEFGAGRADSYRYLRQDSGSNPAAGVNWSGDYADWYGRAMMALNADDISAGVKENLMDRLIGWGIQTLGLVAEGGDLGGGAGQGGGFTGYCYLAALALNDSTYLADAKSIDGQMHGPHWVDAGDVGYPSNPKTGVNMQTYFTEQVGMPIVTPEGFNTNHDSRYFDAGTRNTIWECLAICMLQAGTGGVSGLAALLDGASQNDTSNDRAALVSYMSRVRQMDAWRHNRNPGTEWRDMWDLVYPVAGITPWTGQPDQMPNNKPDNLNLDHGFFSAGDGSISWDISAYDYATETVTDIEVGYAIDNGVAPVQFVVTTGNSDTGSITSLLKSADHWARIRKVSASGNGPWSANYIQQGAMDGTSGRGQVSTTGTASASAPSNTTAPTIHQRLVPGWEFPMWEAASGTLAANDVDLACGLGYWSGYPAPTFTYQWKRDAGNISGATSQMYTRVAADAGADLTCEITATNASGTPSVTTAAVTCPALRSLPAGTLIDTDFKAAFAIDYVAEIAAATTSNATLSHEPHQNAENLSGIDAGILRADKTGSNPQLDFPLPVAAVAGTTYDITAQIVTAFNFLNSADYFGGTLEFTIRNGSGDVFFTTTLDPIVNKQPELLNISSSFTVPAGTADLDLLFRLRNPVGTGGTAAGDPAIAKISIAESA